MEMSRGSNDTRRLTARVDRPGRNGNCRIDGAVRARFARPAPPSSRHEHESAAHAGLWGVRRPTERRPKWQGAGAAAFDSSGLFSAADHGDFVSSVRLDLDGLLK